MKERDHFLALIGRHADGIATREEARELEAALLKHTELRREFLRYLHLDAALAGAAPVLHLVREEPPVGARRRHAWWIGLGAAAVLIVAFGLPFLARKAESRRAATPALAVLAAANDAVWADSNVELALRGGELPPDALRLESGTAEFLCADGATVVMRGPAVVRFPERRRVFVESGRLFFRCPTPESRLSVVTPATEVIDLGTEFAVEARADRSTLVAVLSGEVEVGKTAPQRLRKGEAVEVRSDGILAIQPLAREEFSELLLASPSVNDAVQRGGNCTNLPILLAGGGLKHGHHLAFNTAHNKPLCNLFVSMLQNMGIETETFGSSGGTLTGLDRI